MTPNLRSFQICSQSRCSSPETSCSPELVKSTLSSRDSGRTDQTEPKFGFIVKFWPDKPKVGPEHYPGNPKWKSETKLMSTVFFFFAFFFLLFFFAFLQHKAQTCWFTSCISCPFWFLTIVGLFVCLFSLDASNWVNFDRCVGVLQGATRIPAVLHGIRIWYVSTACVISLGCNELFWAHYLENIGVFINFYVSWIYITL